MFGLIDLIKSASTVIKWYIDFDVDLIISTSSIVNSYSRASKRRLTSFNLPLCSFMRVIRCRLVWPTYHDRHCGHEILYTTPLLRDLSIDCFNEGKHAFVLLIVAINFICAFIYLKALSNLSVTLPRYWTLN